LKKNILLITLITISMLSTLRVFGSDDVQINSVLSSNEEQNKFNDNIANSDKDKNLCIEAYKRKNQGIANYNIEDPYEGVHPSENIKIYAFTTMKTNEFYEEYEGNNDLENFISSNYSIVALFRNKNDVFMDSIFYLKSEKAEQSDDQWERVSSGGMIFSDETIEFLSDSNNIKDLLSSFHIVQPQNLKVITGVEGVEGLLYFETNGTQIVVPLRDGYKYNEDTNVCKKFTPYVASEFFEARKVSAFDNAVKLEQWNQLPLEDKTFGKGGDINYVNLKTADYISELSINDDNQEIELVPKRQYNYAPMIMIIVLALGGAVLVSKKNFKNVNIYKSH